MWLYHKIRSHWKWKQNPWRIHMEPASDINLMKNPLGYCLQAFHEREDLMLRKHPVYLNFLSGSCGWVWNFPMSPEGLPGKGDDFGSEPQGMCTLTALLREVIWLPGLLYGMANTNKSI